MVGGGKKLGKKVGKLFYKAGIQRNAKNSKLHKS
jgi:hypothetical protein